MLNCIILKASKNKFIYPGQCLIHQRKNSKDYGKTLATAQ